MTDNRKLVTVVVGTRPEAVKLSPVILAMRDHPRLRCRVVLTGQHRDLAEPVLRDFGITADIRFALECDDGPSMTSTMAAILTGMNVDLRDNPPAMVLVQGDTTTTLAGALAAFYHRIPVGHVEAGLRTGDMGCPWPEEGNRRMISQISAVHFCTTQGALVNLTYYSRLSPKSIKVVGNTVVDAVRIAREKERQKIDTMRYKRLVVVTCHRRESFGEGLRNVCSAVAELASAFPDAAFFWPVHPNPFIREVAEDYLPWSNNVIVNCPVLSYPDFISVLERADLILTDSGGIQEEACILGKPTLVLREKTDRPETLGDRCILVGTNRERIIEVASKVIDELRYSYPDTTIQCLYGDGHASEKIVTTIDEFLENRK